MYLSVLTHTATSQSAQTRRVNTLRIKRITTSLDGPDHPDEEACAVIERQVDVEDVL